MLNLNDYLTELQQHLSTGDAREHTYRPATEKLFSGFEDIQAANDQARTAHGATDFVFYKKSNTKIILGYAEAKDINVDLDKTEKSEQLVRYAGYDNLILTNYIEFRFFKNGIKYASVEIAKLDDLHLTALPENFDQLNNELQAFFDQPPEVIKSGKRLAEIMGAKARRIRDNIQVLLKQNQEDATKAVDIAKIYALMREMLVHDMSVEEFADMYAQTLVYGLFVARYNDKTPEDFTRAEARDLVPISNPFLREFFDHIAGPRFETRLAIIVEELCDVFAVSNVAEIIDKHFKINEDSQKDIKDPIIHFYENFLEKYDSEIRKKMGAYYTPTPVVRYIVRAVDSVLKEHFGITKGLVDSHTDSYERIVQGKKIKETYHKVQILDPATGTATFLNEIINFAHSSFTGQEGVWPAYAKENLIPRLHGFELMMGAYTIAHLKLGLTLKSLGVTDVGKRLGVYLTNSLEEGIPHQSDLFSQFGLAEAVTREAQEAAHIKSERPIMVVIGNPPYSGVSSNETKHANTLIEKYKVEPGGKEKLQERKHWLNDDYVKFIAMAEELIIKNNEGVLAFITNHGYLDNPTFRGMRWHLAQTFDYIDIIDLHGNTKRKEAAPDGSKDENVFNIQQGVAIIIATKLKGSSKHDAVVRVADVYGKRKNKFEALNTNQMQFKEVTLDKKLYYFVDKNTEGKSEYETGFSISEIFSKNTTGIVTMGDNFIVDENKDALIKRVDEFLHNDISELELKNKYNLGKNYGKWIIDNKSKIENDQSKVVPISYRPFDTRYTYFDNNLVWRPRTEVMQHFVNRENIGITCMRSAIDTDNVPILISKSIIDMNFYGFSTILSPLYLFIDNKKVPNLNEEIWNKISTLVGETKPEDILDYIYGVLHWPAYREKYKEFLKIDFPRVPYPKNQEEFEKFRTVGEKLRNLHLMIDPALDTLITTYPVICDDMVEKIKYEDNRVYINDTQYFGGIPLAAWEFHVGGYQPAQKWLKDRKGRTLSSEDITHYQKIIKVLTETDRVMKENNDIAVL
jgi:predicted helicase